MLSVVRLATCKCKYIYWPDMNSDKSSILSLKKKYYCILLLINNFKTYYIYCTYYHLCIFFIVHLYNTLYYFKIQIFYDFYNYHIINLPSPKQNIHCLALNMYLQLLMCTFQNKIYALNFCYTFYLNYSKV